MHQWRLLNYLTVLRWQNRLHRVPDTGSVSKKPGLPGFFFAVTALGTEESIP
jgi:hypothetical protein